MKTSIPIVTAGLLIALVAFSGCSGPDVGEATEEARAEFKAFAARLAGALAPGVDAERVVRGTDVVRVRGENNGSVILTLGRVQYEADLAERDGGWELLRLRYVTREGDVKPADEAMTTKVKAAVDAANAADQE